MSIEFRFGNVAPLEAYTTPVSATDASAEELRKTAEKRGVDASGTKEQIAARLTAQTQHRALRGERETVIVVPDPRPDLVDPVTGVMLDDPVAEALNAWRHHSTQPPVWVECSNPTYEQAIKRLTGARVGRPTNWKGLAVDPSDEARYSARDESGSARLALLAWWLVTPFLRTAAGRDFQARVMSDTASTGTGTYAPANWIALTENSTAPADADTVLTGEITTQGLARSQATYAKTAGSSSYTLTKTFTMTSGAATSFTLQKLGVFNASSGGSLVFESAIPNPPVLVANDQVVITETVNL